MQKQQLRDIYSKKRSELSVQERSKLDDLLLIQFQRLPFENVQVVLSFWPMEERAEMNTHLYTRYLSHLIPGLRIGYPLIDPSSNYMDAFAVDDDTEFEENKYGITEPVNGEKVDPKEIDLIIMPLFAFDESGYRVGYGKGYYDRFISRCKPEVITVGISYFEAVDKVDDTHHYDVPLNYCITPYKVYEF
ncbi:MAG: 5-formyltetrahydrofolate cyclo-ligase [Segetibacter sp.]|jgi:5-formyltetrahydrofolate cyclo-ligase|nr:5-formyltetrahydrofolate cyclo-ligase [Segetibacter sp.]